MVILKGLDQVSGPARQAQGAIQSFVDKVQMMGLALGGISAYAVHKLSLIGAQSLQVKKAYEIMTRDMGANADQLLKDLTRLSGGTIDQTNLMLEANKAMIAKIPIDAIRKMMEIARSAATATGTSVTEAFQRLVGGVSRMETELLKGVGIIVRQEEAFKEYAATLGKTATQLTSAERQQAFLNKVMSEGSEIIRKVGEAGSKVTEMEVFQQLTAAVDNFKSALGERLVPVLLPIVEWLTRALEKLGQYQGTIVEVIKAVTAFGVSLTTLIGIIKIFNFVSSIGPLGLIAMAAGALFAGKMMDWLSGKMAAGADATKNLRDEFWGLYNSIDSMTKETLLDAQERLKALAEQVNDLGISLDQPLSQALDKINERLSYLDSITVQSTQELTMLDKAINNITGSIKEMAAAEDLVEKTATDTLDALLNQEEVTKKKYETTEEFAQRLRDLGLAEEYVQKAVEANSITLEGQDELMKVMGETYLTWINTMRESQGLIALTADQIGLLSENMDGLNNKTSGLVQGSSILSTALNNLITDLDNVAKSENIVEQTATATLEALLNQQKVTKRKDETVEEFAERLRSLGLSEEYVQQAMRDGSIQLQGQDQLLDALGNTYSTWLNKLRETYGLANLTSDAIRKLSESYDNLAKVTTQIGTATVVPALQAGAWMVVNRNPATEQGPQSVPQDVITSNERYNQLLNDRNRLLREADVRMGSQMALQRQLGYSLDVEMKNRKGGI